MKFDQNHIILKEIKKFSHRFQNFIFQSRSFEEWWLFKMPITGYFWKTIWNYAAIKLKYKDLRAKSFQRFQSFPNCLEIKIKPSHWTFRTAFYKTYLRDWFWVWPVMKTVIFGLTLFCHWFHQLVIFRNTFLLILTLPGSIYTPLQINTCLSQQQKYLEKVLH